jgi:hypothetical protein
MVDLLAYFDQNMGVGIIVGLPTLIFGLVVSAALMSKGSGLASACAFILTMVISMTAITPTFVSVVMGVDDEYFELVSENKSNASVHQLNLSDDELIKLKKLLQN